MTELPDDGTINFESLGGVKEKKPTPTYFTLPDTYRRGEQILQVLTQALADLHHAHDLSNVKQVMRDVLLVIANDYKLQNQAIAQVVRPEDLVRPDAVTSSVHTQGEEDNG